MSVNNNKAYSDFLNKSFKEKKIFLLTILKKFPLDNDLINKLWESIYWLNSMEKEYILDEFYRIILDSIDKVWVIKQNEMEIIIKKTNEYLKNVKDEEIKEISVELANLDKLFDNI